MVNLNVNFCYYVFKQKFSKELYSIDKKEGYKLIIKDEKRKLGRLRRLWQVSGQRAP